MVKHEAFREKEGIPLLTYLILAHEFVLGPRVEAIVLAGTVPYTGCAHDVTPAMGDALHRRERAHIVYLRRDSQRKLRW